jgi:hypothetical protein
MKHRKLRIAWSVAWGVAAVLLCVLWVRSYTWRDDLICHFPRSAGVFSDRGYMQVHVSSDFEQMLYPDQPGWKSRPTKFPPTFFWSCHIDKFGLFIGSPHWFPASICVIVASLPFLPYSTTKFSLRALLIATTLIAVGLGLIVWLAR